MELPLSSASALPRRLLRPSQQIRPRAELIPTLQC